MSMAGQSVSELRLLEDHLRKLESKLLRQVTAVSETQQVIALYRAKLEEYKSGVQSKDVPRTK